MKRQLHFIRGFGCCAVLLLFANVLSAKEQKHGLLTDFRFIVNDTQEFPNYFDNENISLAVHNSCVKFIKNKLAVETIDTYQAKEVEYAFAPPFRDNINIISKNKYDYYIAVTSSAGINTSYTGEKTYLIYLKVQIQNAQGNPIFTNKEKAKFKLSYNTQMLYDEAVIKGEDFKLLYIELLEKTFFEKEQQIEKHFFKPNITIFNSFIKKATACTFHQTSGRSKSKFFDVGKTTKPLFLIRQKKISTLGSYELNKISKVSKFLKEYQLIDKATKTKYSIKGMYEEGLNRIANRKYVTTPTLTLKHKNDLVLFRFYPNQDMRWLYTLDGDYHDKNYSLQANLYTNYLEVNADGQLITLIQLPTSMIKTRTLREKNYIFYFKQDLTANDKQDIFYLILFYATFETNIVM